MSLGVGDGRTRCGVVEGGLAMVHEDLWEEGRSFRRGQEDCA